MRFQTIYWGALAFLRGGSGLAFRATGTERTLGSSTHEITVAPFFFFFFFYRFYMLFHIQKGFEQLVKKHRFENQDWVWNTCCNSQSTFTELSSSRISLKSFSGCRSPLCHTGWKQPSATDWWQCVYECPSSLTSQVRSYGLPCLPGFPRGIKSQVPTVDNQLGNAPPISYFPFPASHPANVSWAPFLPRSASGPTQTKK